MSKALSTALIDYLTYTNRKPDATPITVIKDDLRLNPDMFVQLSYSPLPHYNRSLKLGDMYVSYEPIKVVSDVSLSATDTLAEYGIDLQEIDQRQGICVSMSGNGCRQFEQYSKRGGGKMSPMADLLHYLYEQGRDAIHVTRIDVAIDDKYGLLDMDTVVAAAQSRDGMTINSRIRKRRVIMECDGDRPGGCTVYIGAASSMFRVRIYDKAKETYKPDQPEYNQHWVRFEMVLRVKEAEGFLAAYCNTNTLGELAAQVINGHMRFVDCDDTNITRCTVCQWWLDFLDGITDCLKLVTADPAPHTIERKYSYLLWQMSPTIAAVYDTMGMVAFRRWLEYGASHMSKQLRACRDDYLATKQARVSN